MLFHQKKLPQSGVIIFNYIFIFFLMTSCTSEKKINVDYSDGTLLNEWNHTLTGTIVQDLFNPPVASRIYSYANLAAYEAIKFSDSANKSITARLKEFDEISTAHSDIQIDYKIASMTAFVTVALKLVYTETFLDNYSKHYLDSMRISGIENSIIDSSVSFGKKVAGIILKRASADMFKQTRGMMRYNLLNTPGSWLPTPPDYLPAVEPNWKLIHPFFLDSCSAFRPDPFLLYSTEKNSDFYNAAIEVYEVSKSLDSEKVSIAKFWDDNPNVSSHFGHLTIMNQKMTPGGHWMAVVANAVKNKKLTIAEAARTYALTAVAITDAFIACWEAKFTYSTVRPVTYINKYIDNDWQPYLQTPPFPEFPSGHSTISASAATVLTSLIGDNYAFTDSSEIEFGLPVRSFTSFYDASDEAAVSRLYGGIHFMFANEGGKKLGIKVGNALLHKINDAE